MSRLAEIFVLKLFIEEEKKPEEIIIRIKGFI